MTEEINNCVKILQDGGTILYPTDTIWGIGCDATNQKAVKKIYQIKKRMESKSVIVLLSSMDLLSDYVKTIPTIAYDLLNSVDSPLTIIYPQAKKLAKSTIASDGSVAIRIVKRNKFCIQLLQTFGKPVVSTSANITGQPAPLIFKCIPPEIKSQVDYIVQGEEHLLQTVKPSTIIRIKENGEFEIIRK